MLLSFIKSFNMPRLCIISKAVCIVFMMITILMINWLISLYEIDHNIGTLYNGMEECTFFYLNSDNYAPKDFEKASAELKAYHRLHMNYCRIDKKIFSTVVSDDFLTQNINLKLDKGKPISDETEIILSKSAGDFYKVGDQLTVEYFNEHKEICSVTKQVCGILENNIFPTSSSSGMTMNITLMAENLSDTNNSFGGDLGCGFITTDERLKDPREQATGLYFLESKNSPDVLLSDLSMMGIGVAGKEIIWQANENVQYLKKSYTVIIVTLVLLSLVIIVGSNIIDFYVRKNEIYVQLLCGIEEKMIQRLEILKAITLGAISTIAALVGSEILVKKIHGFDITFGGTLFGFLTLFLFVVVSFLTLKIFIKNENLSEELRGE